MEFLDGIAFWHWWIFAVALLILEIFAPGALFMWLAIAAGVTGTLVLLPVDVSWQVQFLVFAGLSVASTIIGRKWMSRHAIETDHPLLNQRGQQYVRQTFTLSESIINGVGKIRAGDTVWRVTGPKIQAGEDVRVIQVDGSTLIVEPIDKNNTAP